MEDDQEHRPLAFYFLMALLLFQAFSAIFGGAALVISPRGELLHMPLGMLENTPFKDYFVPGLILLFLLGVFPLFVSIVLWSKPEWAWAERLNIYTDRHWAWTFSLYLAIMLILWMDFQIMLVGGGHFLQSGYALLGVAILLLTLWPSVMRYFFRSAKAKG